MFVSQPKAAADELARVCKPGGRLGLVAWVPDGTVAGLFGVMRAYLPPAPANPPPFDWGRPEKVCELLGDAFDLKFETGTTTLRMPDGAAVWDLFVAGFGPTKTVFATLDESRREQMGPPPRSFAADAHDRIMV
jgi:hypothetical protein